MTSQPSRSCSCSQFRQLLLIIGLLGEVCIFCSYTVPCYCFHVCLANKKSHSNVLYELIWAQKEREGEWVGGGEVRRGALVREDQKNWETFLQERVGLWVAENGVTFWSSKPLQSASKQHQSSTYMWYCKVTPSIWLFLFLARLVHKSSKCLSQ